MRKLLVGIFLFFLSALAHAQCTGVFPPGTVCGNNTGSTRPPFAISSSSTLTGPGSSVVGDLALWNNITGSSLKDQAPGALTGVNDTNVTLTFGGSASIALVNPASITAGWTGTLAAGRLNSNVVQSVVNDTNVTGSIAAQALTLGWTGTLASGRLNSNVVQSFTNDTNVTASISAQNATLGWAGTLAIARGGTGAGTQSGAAANVFPTPTRTGDIAFWNGTIWTTLAGNNSGTQLLQENSSGLPSWVTVTGTGTVTSLTIQAGVVGTSNPITTSGTISADGNYTGFANANCTLSASVASNILTVALKDNTGVDPTAASPCNLNYRSATASTGSTTLVQQTAALSISTFATGATLGSQNNTAFRFWIVAFNNGGSNVLALINCSSSSQIFPLNEYATASSTAISGSATSAGVFYTPNGTTVTSKTFRILGYIEYSAGLATAGTYNIAPTLVQAFGPGIPKPGAVVQTIFNSDSTQTVAGSTTKVQSSTSITITPTAAMNKILVQVTGLLQDQNATNNAYAQISRTSSFNAVGNQGVVFGASPNVNSSIPLMGIDSPNTTSATLYVVFVWGQGTAAGAFVWNPTGPGATPAATILAQEIMG